MLKLIMGRSGSGKTHWILERMAALTQQGQEKIFWLVPEQHSFACERALLQRLGPVQAARVQVLSFSRLADWVFREIGGLAGQPLDDGVRALLMSRALEQVAETAADQGDPMQGLRPRLVTDSAYVERLLSLWEELRRCAVPTQELERVAAELAEEETSLLVTKTEDLYRVFTTYEGLVKQTGLRETDDLTRLAEVLPRSSLLCQAAVFVDGFKGFTQQEMILLDRMMPQVAELAVALCADARGQRETPLFAPVIDTVKRLQELAREHHAMVWETVALEENHRTASPALRALEEGLYAPIPAVYEGAAPEVVVTPCSSVYEECRYAVRQLRRLLREGYRCREIAVAVRHLADYQGILDDLLQVEGIPYYMDQRQDLLCQPLVVYLRCALRLAVDGWRTEELLRLMKTDLWPLNPVEIAEVENYVYTWRIDGAGWEQTWTENPRGMDRKMGEEDRALLERLNERRQALMDSLGGLRQALRGGATGRQFALAVYRWLTAQTGLQERMMHQVEVLETMAQPVLAAHAARLWDEMMKILDRFVVALGDQRLSATRLEELFTMLCRTIDMGAIPQGLDAVQVGSVDRMRFDAPKVVLVLGANEGVLPAYPMGDGLLTEEERRRLKERGLNLAEDVLTQCLEERYYAYLALTAPSQRLIVTYRSEEESGPSAVVTALRKILPGHTADREAYADGTDLESADEIFRRLAYSYGKPAPVSATLRRALENAPQQNHRLTAVERSAAAGMDYRMEEADTAKALFRQDMTLSASKADTFYKCKFKYFCQYGMGLQERRVAQIDGGIFGTLVHYAMEKLLPVYCQPGNLVEQLRKTRTALIPDPALKKTLTEQVEELLDGYVESDMGGIRDKDGTFRYQLGLAKQSSVNLLWHTLVEFQQSKFNPVAFELPITPADKEGAKGVPSLTLPLEEGQIRFSGKVDRVDVYEAPDGTVYLRVVDYKTGNVEFKLHELTEGQGMQMLLYLFTLCENYRYQKAESDQATAVTPAGVLYHPLTDLTVERGATAGQRLERMRMDGVVLADREVIQAMEETTSATFIPAKVDAGGNPTNNVATPDQFALLKRLIEKLLIQMGNSLLRGDIEALPVKSGPYEHCTYCDYKAICGHEQEDPVKELKVPDEDKYKKFPAKLERLEQELAKEVTADE